MPSFPFTFLFQSYINKVSTTSQNIFYLKSTTSSYDNLLFKRTPTLNGDVFSLYRERPSTSAMTEIIGISGVEAATLSAYYNNQLIPFSLRNDGTYFYLDTFLSSYTGSVTSNFDSFNFQLILGGTTGSNIGPLDPIIGTYANVKYFVKYQPSISSYFIDPHARYEEKNMLFDYKLYDVPTITALNSFIFGSTSLTANAVLSGSSAYDLFPITLTREYYTSGASLPGGNFIVLDKDSKRRGSSNFGYGLFSSETLNNDILDFYTSASSFNYSTLFADPSFYYFDKGHNWNQLANHRYTVINDTRYPNGINYRKFLKAIEKYKYILTGFFRTVEQFIRFRSKVIQKGVNIEPTILDREKHRIDSSLSSNPQKNIVFTQQPPETIDIESRNATNTGYNRFYTVLSPNEEIVIPTYSTSSNSFSQSDILIEGIKEISAEKFTNFDQQINDLVIEPVSYDGIQFNDTSQYLNNEKIQIMKKSISEGSKTVSLLNKNVIETSSDLVLTITGNQFFNYFPDTALTGGTIINTIYLDGFIKNNTINSIIQVNTSPFFLTGAYVFSFFKNTIPLTGFYQRTQAGTTSCTGNFSADLLKFNFKDFGIETDKSYFRKFVNLNVKIENNSDYINDNNVGIFEIDSQIDKQTQQPIFHFYCYNNDTYYREFPFRVNNISKDGLHFLIASNPIFGDQTLGKRNIFIKNLLSNETLIESIDIVQLIDDQNYTGSGNNGSRESQAQFVDNHLIDASDISNGYITFGQASNTLVDIKKGIIVLINGVEQQEFVYWTYVTSGNQNRIDFDTSVTTVGDTITVKYKY